MGPLISVPPANLRRAASSNISAAPAAGFTTLPADGEPRHRPWRRQVSTAELIAAIITRLPLRITVISSEISSTSWSLWLMNDGAARLVRCRSLAKARVSCGVSTAVSSSIMSTLASR